MPRLSGEPVERVHVLLYKSDIQELKMRYGNRPGFGPAVRRVVRMFVKALDQKLANLPDSAEITEELGGEVLEEMDT